MGASSTGTSFPTVGIGSTSHAFPTVVTHVDFRVSSFGTLAIALRPCFCERPLSMPGAGWRRSFFLLARSLLAVGR